MNAVDVACRLEVPLILHTGDFGIRRGENEFLIRLDEALGQHGIQLWFVDGNHEDFDLLATYPATDDGCTCVGSKIWHLPRGHRLTAAGLTWVACGGAASIDRTFRVEGVSWWPQERISEADVAGCAAGGPASVLLSHEAPENVPTLIKAYAGPSSWPSSGLRESAQSRRALSAVVEAVRPRWIFHGHHHLRYTDFVDGFAIHGLGAGVSDNLVHL